MLARAWIACGLPDRAREFLAARRETAEAGGRGRHLIAIDALQALALDAQGDRHGAVGALEQAFALAEPEGYMRTFLDEGAPMLALLREALRRRLCPAYVGHLLQAFEAGSSAP